MEWLIPCHIPDEDAGPDGVQHERLLLEFARWVLTTYASLGTVAGCRPTMKAASTLTRATRTRQLFAEGER